jgi:TonB family protein
VGESKDGKTLFLNFGGPYPDHVFNAIIPESSLASFPEARSWAGKPLLVRGKVQLYKGGMPEIALERREQVTLDSGTAAAPPPESAAAPSREVPSPVSSDSPPRPTRIIPPRYPSEAYDKRVQGTVLVEILIDSEGRVVRARVLRSVPLLDAAALETVYQWRFQPATKQGKAVPTIAHAPVVFRIGSRPEPRQQRQQQPVNVSR